MSVSFSWIKKSNKARKKITNAVISAQWSGSVEQACRTLEITIPNAPNDKYVKALKLNIACGDYIIAYQSGDMFFYGSVTTIEKKGATDTSLTITCKDMIDHLLRSQATYKFKGKTAEYIARKMCNTFKIKPGNIVRTKTKLKKMICEDRSIYEIIMRAYTKASKHTGKKYIMRMNGLKLNIAEKGTTVKNFYFSEDVNITSSTYTETIEEMINRVVIYSEKGKKIGTVQSTSNVKKYGVYQGTYTKEKGVNAKKAAKALLEGKTKTISIEVVDPTMQCIAGNAVKIYDKATGLSGKFWIDNDSHTFENNTHTAQLDLTYKNLWDKQTE